MAQLVKNSACNVGDLGSIPGLGRSPGERQGYPLQYSGLENSVGYIVHGVAKSRTQLSDFHSHPWVSMTNKRLLELEERQQRRSPAIGCHSVAEHWPRKLCLFPVAPGAWNTVTHILFARKVKVVQSRPRLTLCNPMDYTFHGILQARILEWVAFPFYRESSQPKNRTEVSCISGRFFTN